MRLAHNADEWAGEGGQRKTKTINYDISRTCRIGNKEENKPLTSNEIWNLAVKKGYDKQLIQREKHLGNFLGALILCKCKTHPTHIFSKQILDPKVLFERYGR